MMTVVVTACAAFGLTVLEAKTEFMCLHKKGAGKVPFTAAVVSPVQYEIVELVYLCGAIRGESDLIGEIARRLQRTWSCFRRDSIHWTAGVCACN